MYDTIVIGAGPAGMISSITSSMNKKKTLLIEKNNIVGKKLKLTGGGRCNLTNLKDTNGFINELSVNKKFMYSSINTFGPHDIYKYIEDLKVPLKVETSDRVFPISNKSETIINALYNKMIDLKVEIHLNENVLNIKKSIDDTYEVITNKFTYSTKKIIIATGGISYPETGSTGSGYKFSEYLNQPLIERYPAEVYLYTKNTSSLAGITLDKVTLSLDDFKVTESILFTHFGISGPATFRISEYVYKKLKENHEVFINIDFIPDISSDKLLKILNNFDSKKELSSFIKEYLPKTLVNYLFKEIDLKKKIASISKMDRIKIINILKEFQLEIEKTGPIDKSIVTGGGVDTKYINPKTMESTINKGIYFAGEVLDIHGHTGGYNITLALSTGFVAGSN